MIGTPGILTDCALIDDFSVAQRELQQLTDTSGASGHQKLRVCDICGAYLSVLDSDRRLADHFGGKVSPDSCRPQRNLHEENNKERFLTCRIDYLFYRCIWATTSYGICCRSLRRNARRRRTHPLLKRCHPAPMVLEAGHRDGMGLTETIDRRETITGNGIEDITARATSKQHGVP